LTIPFEPVCFGLKINIHLVLEYLAFFIAFRYYLYLRKNQIDHISGANRLSIILGAAVGALLGSRMIGFLENPHFSHHATDLLKLLNIKTIMGGLFGGMIGVEITKKRIKEKSASGDLFTLPIILGIFIGRIGCFLSGTNEFTYGAETSYFTGMDLGDGILRHPTSLYEMIFLAALYFICMRLYSIKEDRNGELFKIFMLSYFGFRFFIEFIKPNQFHIFSLSTIQWLCIICWIYYWPFISKNIKYAYKKLHLL